jgi:hypothetical protein
MEHVISRHLSGKANASQFSLSEAELWSVLSSRAAANSPVVRSVESTDGIRYVREFDAGRAIGADKFNGNQATSVMTIMTDRFGNLVSTSRGRSNEVDWKSHRTADARRAGSFECLVAGR